MYSQETLRLFLLQNAANAAVLQQTPAFNQHQQQQQSLLSLINAQQELNTNNNSMLNNFRNFMPNTLMCNTNTKDDDIDSNLVNYCITCNQKIVGKNAFEVHIRVCKMGVTGLMNNNSLDVNNQGISLDIDHSADPEKIVFLKRLAKLNIKPIGIEHVVEFHLKFSDDYFSNGNEKLYCKLCAVKIIDLGNKHLMQHFQEPKHTLRYLKLTCLNEYNRIQKDAKDYATLEKELKRIDFKKIYGSTLETKRAILVKLPDLRTEFDRFCDELKKHEQRVELDDNLLQILRKPKKKMINLMDIAYDNIPSMPGLQDKQMSSSDSQLDSNKEDPASSHKRKQEDSNIDSEVVAANHKSIVKKSRSKPEPSSKEQFDHNYVKKTDGACEVNPIRRDPSPMFDSACDESEIEDFLKEQNALDENTMCRLKFLQQLKRSSQYDAPELRKQKLRDIMNMYLSATDTLMGQYEFLTETADIVNEMIQDFRERVTKSTVNNDEKDDDVYREVNILDLVQPGQQPLQETIYEATTSIDDALTIIKQLLENQIEFDDDKISKTTIKDISYYIKSKIIQMDECEMTYLAAKLRKSMKQNKKEEVEPEKSRKPQACLSVSIAEDTETDLT